MTALLHVMLWGAAAHQITTVLLHGVLPPIAPPPVVLPVMSSLCCHSCATPCCTATTALPCVVPQGTAACYIAVMPLPMVLPVMLSLCHHSHAAPHHTATTVQPHVVPWGIAACRAATHGAACCRSCTATYCVATTIPPPITFVACCAIAVLVLPSHCCMSYCSVLPPDMLLVILQLCCKQYLK